MSTQVESVDGPTPDEELPEPAPGSEQDAGPEAEPGVEPADEVEERTYPSTIGGAFYLLLLTVAAVALGIVAAGSWRNGVRLFGGVLVVAAALRMALGPRDAGMLAVRSRPVDAFLLTSVGLAIIVLASSIPDQPV